MIYSSLIEWTNLPGVLVPYRHNLNEKPFSYTIRTVHRLWKIPYQEALSTCLGKVESLLDGIDMI